MCIALSSKPLGGACGGPTARKPIAPSDIGKTLLAGRFLHLTYDLTTGHWQLRSTSAGAALSLAATAQVELLAPDGSAQIRDVATASLTTCRQEMSDDERPGID